MSEENVEILRRVYSDWGRGNLRAGTTVFAPDVVCTWQVPEGRIVCRGPQEIRENMRPFLEQWSEWRMEAGEFLDLDARRTEYLSSATPTQREKRAALRWRRPRFTPGFSGTQGGCMALLLRPR
jgi:SnoaL-like domain